MEADTTLLPLAISNFSELRQKGKIYVDKTRQIYKLARSDVPIFLSRPRRFGKSLLVSTFESLFSKGLEDFKGLEIEDLWKEDKTYDILHFDFSLIDSDTAESFEKDLAKSLVEVSSPYGMQPQATDFASVFSAFRVWLKMQPINKYVLLIDEYDSPLTRLLNAPTEFDAARKVLSKFYAAIKSYKKAFRFIFITGIARFQKASLFSAMNNIDDITLEPEYGSLLGYTQEELEQYFDPYLIHAAQTLKMSKKELLVRMQAQYDGFCFDEKSTYRLYAPWSVLKFLNRPASGFKQYWTESGGGLTLLKEYFTSHKLLSLDDYDKEQILGRSQLTDPSTVEAIDPIALMTQAGYFTIDHVDGNSFYLRYPNGEVRAAMARMYTEYLLRNKPAVQDRLDRIGEAIGDTDADKIVQILNTAFLSIPYDRSKVVFNEASVESHLSMFLNGEGLFVQTEKHNADGRADIVVSTDDRHYCVIELKYSKDTGLDEVKSEKEAQRLLKEAVEQIKTKRYGEEIRYQSMVRIAMVFSEKAKQFVQWAKVG